MSERIVGRSAAADELASLAEQIKRQQDALARLRRTFEDLIYNLDTENMPEVAALIASYREESREAFASVSARADAQGERLSLLVGEDGEVDGSVIVSAINGQSEVSIDADRIDLNGAVTANGNFRIKTDGSVECRDLTLSGGRVNVPCELGRRDPVLSAGDEASGRFSGVYSDRIFVGMMENIESRVGETTVVSANSVTCTEADNYSDDRVVRLGSFTGDSFVLSRTHYGTDGERLESDDNAGIQLSPDGIICRGIYESEIPDAMLDNLKALYIDRSGRIWAY